MYGTAKNQRFKDDMARLEDQYNDGTDMTSEEVMKKSEVKYNNLKKNEKWDMSDPRDAQILVLTTVLTGLVKQSGKTDNVNKPKKLKVSNKRNDGP